MIEHTTGPWETVEDCDGDFSVKTTYEFERTEKNHIYGGTFKSKSRLTIAEVLSATTKAYFPSPKEKRGNAIILGNSLAMFEIMRRISRASLEDDQVMLNKAISSAVKIVNKIETE